LPKEYKYHVYAVLVALSPQSFIDLASVYKFPASKADDLLLYLPAFEVYEAVIFSAAFLVFHLLIFIKFIYCAFLFSDCMCRQILFQVWSWLILRILKINPQCSLSK